MSNQEGKSAFDDFISGLNFDNSVQVGGYSEDNIPLSDLRPDHFPDIEEIKLDKENGKFQYRIKVQDARFGLSLYSKDNSPHIFLYYPSRRTYLHPKEMIPVVDSFIHIVYPNNRNIPHVTLSRRNDERYLNLSNYWDGQIYEGSFTDDLTAVYYSINVSSPHNLDPVQIPKPSHFMYGFYKNGRGGISELVEMTYTLATQMKPGFAQELLHKNSGYFLDQDIESDAQKLKNMVSYLAKKHPEQSIDSW